MRIISAQTPSEFRISLSFRASHTFTWLSLRVTALHSSSGTVSFTSWFTFTERVAKWHLKLRKLPALPFSASDSPLQFLSKCILSLQEETHGGPLRKNLWLSSSRQTQGGKIWSDSFTCWFWSVPFQIHLICKTNSAPNMSYTVICTAVTSWLQSNSLLFSESPPPPWKDCFAGVAGADISSSMTDLRSEERGTPPGMASATSTPRRCVRVQQKYKQGIRRFQQVKFKT